MTNADVVRAMFDAYLRGDRAAAEELLGDGLVFSSPQDDFIDRAAYLERCFPTAGRVRSQVLTDVVEVSEHDVFVRYEYVLHSGAEHRNVEVITVVDGRLTEIQVYFGATLSAGSA